MKKFYTRIFIKVNLANVNKMSKSKYFYRNDLCVDLHSIDCCPQTDEALTIYMNHIQSALDVFAIFLFVNSIAKYFNIMTWDTA